MFNMCGDGGPKIGRVTLSISDNTLLYLNLPPNLLISLDDAYALNPSLILVFKSATVEV